MKYLLVILATLCLFSCNKQEIEGYKENVVKTLYGTWDMYLSDTKEGTIEFTYNSQIVMQSNKGNISIADYNLYTEENVIVITYAEDEDGNEILTEEDYDNGGIFCTFVPIKDGETYVLNLPFYQNNKIKLIKH